MNDSPACPLPSRRILTAKEAVQLLATMDRRFWLQAAFIASGAALIIGIPTVLIPNPFFQRMIPTSPIDYVFYVVSVCLIGLTWAVTGETPSRRRREADDTDDTRGREEGKPSLIGTIATVFAVGCPTCNQLVLMLLGTGGALTWFAPLQPLIGIIAVALLWTALRRRLSLIKAGAV